MRGMCGSMEPISQMRGGQHFDRRKGSARLALGARPSTQRLGTYLTTTSLLDGRRVRRPQPRAEVLQSVREGESRLADIFSLDVEPLEVRGRQALRAVDGAQGLTASDLQRFNVKAEDVGKPAFALPDRLKNLGAGLRSSNAAPVE